MDRTSVATKDEMMYLSLFMFMESRKLRARYILHDWSVRIDLKSRAERTAACFVKAVGYLFANNGIWKSRLYWS
jgi:hypothetical protein